MQCSRLMWTSGCRWRLWRATWSRWWVYRLTASSSTVPRTARARGRGTSTLWRNWKARSIWQSGWRVSWPAMSTSSRSTNWYSMQPRYVSQTCKASMQHCFYLQLRRSLTTVASLLAVDIDLILATSTLWLQEL